MNVGVVDEVLKVEEEVLNVGVVVVLNIFVDVLFLNRELFVCVLKVGVVLLNGLVLNGLVVWVLVLNGFGFVLNGLVVVGVLNGFGFDVLKVE